MENTKEENQKLKLTKLKLKTFFAIRKGQGPSDRL